MLADKDKYGIDIIINTHVLIQNQRAVELDQNLDQVLKSLYDQKFKALHNQMLSKKKLFAQDWYSYASAYNTFMKYAQTLKCHGVKSENVFDPRMIAKFMESFCEQGALNLVKQVYPIYEKYFDLSIKHPHSPLQKAQRNNHTHIASWLLEKTGLHVALNPLINKENQSFNGQTLSKAKTLRFSSESQKENTPPSTPQAPRMRYAMA